MEVQWRKRIYIDHQEFIDIKSMPILKNKIGENDCHSGNWNEVDFNVFFLSEILKWDNNV